MMLVVLMMKPRKLLSLLNVPSAFKVMVKTPMSISPCPPVKIQ